MVAMDPIFLIDLILEPLLLKSCESYHFHRHVSERCWNNYQLSWKLVYASSGNSLGSLRLYRKNHIAPLRFRCLKVALEAPLFLDLCIWIFLLANFRAHILCCRTRTLLSSFLEPHKFSMFYRVLATHTWTKQTLGVLPTLHYWDHRSTSPLRKGTKSQVVTTQLILWMLPFNRLHMFCLVYLFLLSEV